MPGTILFYEFKRQLLYKAERKQCDVFVANRWDPSSKTCSRCGKIKTDYTYEAICYKHVSQIRKALDIGSGAAVGTWRYVPRHKDLKEGAQIQLLSDREDEVITICEIQYTSKPLHGIQKTVYSEAYTQSV